MMVSFSCTSHDVFVCRCFGQWAGSICRLRSVMQVLMLCLSEGRAALELAEEKQVSDITELIKTELNFTAL